MSERDWPILVPFIPVSVPWRTYLTRSLGSVVASSVTNLLKTPTPRVFPETPKNTQGIKAVTEPPEPDVLLLNDFSFSL